MTQSVPTESDGRRAPEAEGTSGDALAQLTDRSGSVVKKALDRLMERGLVRCTGMDSGGTDR